MLTAEHVRTQLADLAAASERLGRAVGDADDLPPMVLADAAVRLGKLQGQLHKLGKAIAPSANGHAGDDQAGDKPRRRK